LKNKENKTEITKFKKEDEDDKEVSLYPKAYDVVSWFNIFKVFLGNVKEESDKVTWPTRKETTALVTAVLVLTLFFSIYLGMVDFILSRFVGFLVR